MIGATYSQRPCHACIALGLVGDGDGQLLGAKSYSEDGSSVLVVTVANGQSDYVTAMPPRSSACASP